MALPLAVLLMTGATLGVSAAEEARLPGGTPIEVNARVVRPAQANLPPTIVGQASVGAPQQQVPRRLLYVLDGSGSTLSASGGDCGPDQTPTDPDSAEDEIIDCEIAAAIRLNDAAAGSGTGVAEVAVLMFAGEAVIAQPSPARPGPFVRPDADGNRNGVPDVTEVLRSIQVAHIPEGSPPVGDSGFTQFARRPIATKQGTNFGDAIRKAVEVASPSAEGDTLVVFLSDGQANTGDPVAQVLAGSRVSFRTFAVGAGSSCRGDPERIGSLDDIARLTGSTCTEVKNPAELPEVLAPIITPQLTSLGVALDGRPPTGLSSGEVSAALPVQGPGAVRYEAVLEESGREVCITARGIDAGGMGSVSACRPVGGVAAGVGGLVHVQTGALPATEERKVGPSSVVETVAPRSLLIPSIGLITSIVPVGLQPDGRLAVPSDSQQAGWYQQLTKSGQFAPSVIVGHVDSIAGPGVFHGLTSLDRGDEIGVADENGAIGRFVVDRVEQHPKSAFPTEVVYGATAAPALRLITCGGAFDPVAHSYLDNVVVYASSEPI